MIVKKTIQSAHKRTLCVLCMILCSYAMLENIGNRTFPSHLHRMILPLSVECTWPITPSLAARKQIKQREKRPTRRTLSCGPRQKKP